MPKFENLISSEGSANNHSVDSCVEIVLAGEVLELHPQRCMWWAKEKTLIISDIHLGKSGHFRKHGIAIPTKVNASSLNRFENLIRRYKPGRVLVLGDLFHSEINAEWAEFRNWLQRVYVNYSLKEFRLVEGNHDVLSDEAFDGMNVQRSAKWSRGPFDFVHDPIDFRSQDSPGRIGVAGHLHPAIRLSGKAKQQLHLPGWWFQANPQTLVMPNFGSFTGSSVVKIKAQDQFWVCTKQSVMLVE